MGNGRVKCLAQEVREHNTILIGSLSTRVFEMRTVTGSDLFSLLTCPHTTTFTLLNIFSSLEMSSIKIWETIHSWHAKCSLAVAVRVSKKRVLIKSFPLPGRLDERPWERRCRSAFLANTLFFCLYSWGYRQIWLDSRRSFNRKILESLLHK